MKGGDNDITCEPNSCYLTVKLQSSSLTFSLSGRYKPGCSVSTTSHKLEEEEEALCTTVNNKFSQQ